MCGIPRNKSPLVIFNGSNVKAKVPTKVKLSLKYLKISMRCVRDFYLRISLSSCLVVIILPFDIEVTLGLALG